MPTFDFKAVDQRNQFTEGRIQAVSADNAARRLLETGQIALELRETDAHATREASPRFAVARSQGLTDLLSQIAMLLRSGVPLERALSFLVSSRSHKAAATIAVRLLETVKSGESFAEALRRIQPPAPTFIVNVVAAGEVSGHLEAVLGQLVSYLERSQKVRAEIRSALIYPSILIALAIVAIGILMLVLVPKFKPLFEGAEDRLPASTRLIISASEHFQQGVVGIVVLALVAVLAIRYALKNETRRRSWDRAQFRLPFSVGSLIRDVQVGVFSRLMSLLLQNGVVLQQALALTRDAVPNRAVAAALDSTRNLVREGGRLSAGLAESKIFPALAIDLLKVGEEASNVPDVLGRIADLSEARVERSIKRLMDVLVPSMTIGLGVVVASIVASILMALLSINDLALR